MDIAQKIIGACIRALREQQGMSLDQYKHNHDQRYPDLIYKAGNSGGGLG
jgi:hypothetical protein